MLANTRRDALAMVSYELGDDPWSVGCRAFAFGRHRLERAASSGDYPWLEVLDDSAHFVFVIGGNDNGVPVRFYRGAAEEPTERTLKRQEVEVQQLSLALGEAAAEGLAFRLAVETDGTGRVDRVECFWPVPLEMPPAVAAGAGVQLRLIADDGYAGPDEGASHPAPLPCRAAGSAASNPQRPQTTLV
ncbi:hypothetical protein JMJ56_26950 [Belnapia sp. T18]|uniref:Uncharacterized protein n=1 Tax=Belnapia arida TaxID=2804533 RepID=A0ABS1UAD0_9PROT|nr:hypothetical protein [Belnapia arida]MBL6081635.1 hypothetical protein [Belnapia arida]